MDLKQIKKILSLFNKNSHLSELEIEESGRRVRLKRTAPPTPATPRLVPAPTPRPQAAEILPDESAAPNILKIESPMVGTFYRSSSPSAKPFVELGDVVRKGTVVCIIEAMKLMNEIEAEVEGRAIEILPQNGKPVEYGEPLFLLEPL